MQIKGVSLRGISDVKKALLKNDARLLRLVDRKDVFTQAIINWPFFEEYSEEGIIFER